MSLNDILLHLDSYPEATPPEAIEEVVRFVKNLGGKVSALAVQATFPLHSNRLADYLIKLGSMATEEEARSLAAARGALAHFTAKAQEAEVLGQALLETAEYYALADHVASRAHARDLCIVPLAGALDGQAEVVQSVVFGSGRPVLVFRSGASSLPSSTLGVVVLAWDGSRCASRAMADALPLLTHAKEVRVLTVLNDKPTARAGSGSDAVRHLQAHGVKAIADEVDGAGVTIGATLDAYLARHRPDLLVMGAYGRSRLREFILGGATEHMLYDPKVPLLLSH